MSQHFAGLPDPPSQLSWWLSRGGGWRAKQRQLPTGVPPPAQIFCPPKGAVVECSTLQMETTFRIGPYRQYRLVNRCTTAIHITPQPQASPHRPLELALPPTRVPSHLAPSLHLMVHVPGHPLSPRLIPIPQWWWPGMERRQSRTTRPRSRSS